MCPAFPGPAAVGVGAADGDCSGTAAVWPQTAVEADTRRVSAAAVTSSWCQSERPARHSHTQPQGS